MKDLLLLSLGILVVYFTSPYENTLIHKYLYNKGISQAIQQFENK